MNAQTMEFIDRMGLALESAITYEGLTRWRDKGVAGLQR